MNKVEKYYRVFISSTECLNIEERKLAISTCLTNEKFLPISHENGFYDTNNSSTLDICKKKIEESDFVLLILNGYYGTIINQKCSDCKLNNCIYKKDGDNCSISYTHYEYMYAKEKNRNIYILAKRDLMETYNRDGFLEDATKKCKEYAEKHNIMCCKQCPGTYKHVDKLDDFLELFKNSQIIYYNKDLSNFQLVLSNFLRKYAEEGHPNGLIDGLLLDEIKKGVLAENEFRNQRDAVDDARNILINEKTIKDIRVLCFRGNSFCNNASSDWDQFIFLSNNIDNNTSITFVLGNDNNKSMLRNRFLAFKNNYKDFEAYSKEYKAIMKGIKKRIREKKSEGYKCQLYVHNEHNLKFRMIFVNEHLYLSFFLDGVKAADSPVYKISRENVLYRALEEYYDVIKNSSKSYLKNEITGGEK